MAAVLVVYAHPYPRRSRAGRALLRALEDVRDVLVHSLYDRYPDFGIDVEAEQAALRDADVIVWQSPFYWYGVPAMLQHWFEKVLTHDFAYGRKGDALSGKRLLWVTTTGTSDDDYRPGAVHGHRFADFVHPIEQTARFCGMHWQDPFVVHDAHAMTDEVLYGHATALRARLESIAAEAAPRG